jgi:hypothetical protein
LFPNGSSALVRGLFVDHDNVGEGQLLGSVWVYWPFSGIPGGGIGYGSIILGVTAPKHEFAHLEATLVASLESFTMPQSYVDWCIAQQSQLWGAVAREGQTLSETSDMIFEGWESRSHTSDIIAEQGTDAFRGVERVYDPSTSQVYEVPAGWYATYDLHRGDYSMNDLQLLPDDDWQLWTSPTADGSVIR